jgi:transcriptional regulator with XRE-family HTH domain
MPTRSTPDPFAAKVGGRIRSLRHEKGLTLAQLAQRSGVPTAHLSYIERGFVVIEVGTVAKLAHGLAVQMFDLLTFPEEDDFQRFVDLMRHSSPEELAQLERKLESLSKRGARRRRERNDPPK